MLLLVVISVFMKISLIAAIAEKNRVIGKGNQLIWKIPEDLKRFREITSGHPVIMGRKTYESIGRHLPDRTSIIITREKNYNPHKFSNCSNCDDFRIKICNSLEEALRLAQGKQNDNEIFIIGGGQIFEQAIKIADKLYLTVIEGEFEGDTFFPDYSNFKKVVFEKSGEHEGIKYKFIELEK